MCVGDHDSIRSVIHNLHDIWELFSLTPQSLKKLSLKPKRTNFVYKMMHSSAFNDLPECVVLKKGVLCVLDATKALLLNMENEAH